MAELKTKATDESVTSFLNKVSDEVSPGRLLCGTRDNEGRDRRRTQDVGAQHCGLRTVSLQVRIGA